MIVLGINAYHGDVSAALVCDGALVAAVEEERFRRVKHWAGFPEAAINACLAMAGVEPTDVDAFAISRNPRANWLRKAAFVLRHRPARRLVAGRARNQARVAGVASEIAGALGLDARAVRRRLHWVEHHPAHLASSFFVSPFEEAAVCAIDGFGDFVSTSVARGAGGAMTMLDRVFFPHSLGLLYLAITQYLGFPKYGDEFKVMGLAPYGEPRFADRLRQLVRLHEDGGFELDLSYFAHARGGVDMTWDGGEPTIGRVFSPKLEALLGPARAGGDAPLTGEHDDLAASLQQVFEEAVFHVLNAVHARTGLRRLCLAGGCAMNSVANGKIRERTRFEEVYIQPAAGDNGTALGAAFHAWHALSGKPRSFVMSHAYWGPAFDEADIAGAIGARAAEVRERCTQARIDDQAALCRIAAGFLADGRIVGWFQGRMEWGARALGARSILADPRRADMRDTINTKIKFRERFRPFAPSTLVDAAAAYFVGAAADPFMLQVVPVRPDKRTVIPAVTHVDGSGRLHTVDRQANPLYWSLIGEFGRLTGVPVLLNTSFNENEPIVLRPEEALDCFLRTGMDVLVMGSHILQKA
ncbi:MAG: carbamoyltransferase [Acidobacteria bacterium]|nr:carbamoyltransferase [Acidobacteriota bacterium]